MAFDFADVPTAELVEIYNECQLMVGGNVVSEFKDRAEAERQTRMALSRIVDPSKRPGRFAEGVQKMQTHTHHYAGRDVRFSQRELDLLDMLPKDGSKITSLELVKKYYEDDVPPNARVIIIGRLKNIGDKAERLSLPWRLQKSERAGPRPQSFWIEQV